MSHAHHVTVAGSALRFEVPDGQTILRSALDAGVSLRSACRNGTCRECRCRLLEGEARHTIAWPGLSIEEKREGWILPCVAEALTDLVIALR